MRAKESDKSKVEKWKTEGKVCANGCWCGLFVVACSLFVPGEVFKDKERAELQ